MSFHHEMRLARYGLGRPGDMYSAVNFDPIFTPLFTSILATAGFSTGVTATLASVASAIAICGKHGEFNL